MAGPRTKFWSRVCEVVDPTSFAVRGEPVRDELDHGILSCRVDV